MKSLEKLVSEMVSRKQKLRDRRKNVFDTLEVYGKVVKNKSKVMKTTHGSQWTAIEDAIEKGFVPKIAELNNALDAIMKSLNLVGWNK